MRARRWAVPAVAAIVGGGLAGAPALAQPTTGAGSTPGTATTAGAFPECTPGQLTGTVVGEGGAAGSAVYHLRLRDSSPSRCSVTGWPTLTFADGAGPVGAASTHLPGTRVYVRLTPGGSAWAEFTAADPGDFAGACSPTAVTSLLASPPGWHATRPAAMSTTTCGNPAVRTLRVGPVQAGTGGPGIPLG